ncbi:HPr kinase/phosphatase C-terminal domain-containing protein [Rhodobacteraceae bacterium KMM 6894]|nr:HPr kinase/phosphatase C-terminal domain-containing protein [Rhodobacteraceae bacterium KMM 6894]
MSGPLTLHATCVAVEGRAALIRGASGSGKSGLALQLMALGAGLVADDRTVLWRDGDLLIADAPGPIRGQIEARGIGILNAPAMGPAQVVLLVDLDEDPGVRLPDPATEDILGLPITRVARTDAPHFPAAIHLYLRCGRAA